MPRVRLPTDSELDAAFEPYVAAIGKVAYAWNYLHERLAEIFAVVMRPCSSDVSLAVWYSIKNDRSQRSILSAALNASAKDTWRPAPTVHDDLVWLLTKTNDLGDARDNVIHAPCSAYSDDRGT